MSFASLRAGVLSAFVLSFGLAAEAAPPDIQVFVNGAPVGTVAWMPDPLVVGGYTTTQTFLAGTDVRIGEAFFAPTAAGGWEFSYGLGFTFTDVASRTLSVVFDLPFAASILGPVNGVSNVIGTLVDGTGAGIQILAPASGTVQNVTLLPGIGDNAGLSVGPGYSGAATGASGTSYQYGEYGVTGSVGNALSSWSGLGVVTQFTLQPGSSAVSLDGVVSITPVSEPSGMVLALLGMVALSVRRKSASR